MCMRMCVQMRMRVNMKMRMRMCMRMCMQMHMHMHMQDEYKTKLEGKYENHMRLSAFERTFIEEYREVRKQLREANKPDLLRVLLTVLLSGRLLLVYNFFEFLWRALTNLTAMATNG